MEFRVAPDSPTFSVPLRLLLSGNLGGAWDGCGDGYPLSGNRFRFAGHLNVGPSTPLVDSSIGRP